VGGTFVQSLTTGAEIAKAASDAEAWGFPRVIRPSEIVEADWFRMGPVVFWFQHLPEVSTTYFVHIAVNPEARCRWGARRWLRWIEAYIHDQGGTEIGFIPADEGSEAAEEYLRRLGWDETPYGLARAV